MIIKKPARWGMALTTMDKSRTGKTQRNRTCPALFCLSIAEKSFAVEWRKPVYPEGNLSEHTPPTGYQEKGFARYPLLPDSFGSRLYRLTGSKTV